MTNQSIDSINLVCPSKMKYYDMIDRTKYGTSGVCPQNMYTTKTKVPEALHPHVIKENPCKLNEGNYAEVINYRNKKYSCHNMDKSFPRFGYYDMPCMETQYKNKDFYNLNRALFHFHRSFMNE